MEKNTIFLIIWALLISISASGHVNLKYPKGGETFNPGETVKIEWEILVMHDTQNWDLYWSTDGGDSYNPIEENINVEKLSYDWTVPSEPGNQVRIKVVQDNSGGNYSDVSGNFTIKGTATALYEQKEHAHIQIFPNPASALVNITIPNREGNIRSLSVLSTAGVRLLYQDIDGKPGATECHINISQWPAGVYYLSVLHSNGIEVKKLVVE